MIPDETYDSKKLEIDKLMLRSMIYRTSEGYTKFFNFIASIDHYSRFNSMLVKNQNKDITYYGSETYWEKQHKRGICKDARPYVILTPKGPVSFVYDIFETDGRESPEVFMEKGLGRKPIIMDGRINPGLYLHAVDVAKKWGVKITYKPFSYFKAGEITIVNQPWIEINLKQEQTSEQNFAVLLHELAHLLLGHFGQKELNHSGTKRRLSLPTRNLLPINTKELEAETTCFLVLTKLALKKNSEEYLAAYLKSTDDLIHFSYESVIKTSDKIEKLFINSKLASNWIPEVQQQEELF